MEKPEIVSMIKMNGKWVKQEELPVEDVREMVDTVIMRAAKNIGYKASNLSLKKNGG